MVYAEVAVRAGWGPRQTFTYSVPPHLSLEPGQGVWVPFGPRPAQGIVFALSDTSPVAETRDVTGPIDATPLLSPHHVALAQWMNRYYLAPPFDCAALMAPPGFERRLLTWYCPSSTAPEVDETSLSNEARQALHLLRERGKATESEVAEVLATHRATSILGHLIKKGLVTREWEWERPSVRPKEVVVYRLATGGEEAGSRIASLQKDRKAVQARVLRTLLVHGGLLEQPRLLKLARAPSAQVNALVEQGLVCRETRRVERDPLRGYEAPLPGLEGPRPTLTTHQQEAWLEIAGALEQGRRKDFLLYGVTSSGKTEVYLRAVEYAVSKGKRAIVLVPEIALTPQMVNSFASRFPGRVALLHSGLSPGEQFDEWWRIKQGSFDVVIGPRSAIFSPQPDLGLIVMDEEHEWGYKQESPTPRYHAREVAHTLADLTGAVLVLGSATPAVETYY
ncbi:MAG: DEAD/DEAH box helicase, partial [Chloroflexi bacterium]|nr:DEAD/DEAH box helicase [Chloroflexota bacterium]